MDLLAVQSDDVESFGSSVFSKGAELEIKKPTKEPQGDQIQKTRLYKEVNLSARNGYSEDDDYEDDYEQDTEEAQVEVDEKPQTKETDLKTLPRAAMPHVQNTSNTKPKTELISKKPDQKKTIPVTHTVPKQVQTKPKFSNVGTKQKEMKPTLNRELREEGL